MAESAEGGGVVKGGGGRRLRRPILPPPPPWRAATDERAGAGAGPRRGGRGSPGEGRRGRAAVALGWCSAVWGCPLRPREAGCRPAPGRAVPRHRPAPLHRPCGSFSAGDGSFSVGRSDPTGTRRKPPPAPAQPLLAGPTGKLRCRRSQALRLGEAARRFAAQLWLLTAPEPTRAGGRTPPVLYSGHGWWGFISNADESDRDYSERGSKNQRPQISRWFMQEFARWFYVFWSLRLLQKRASTK